MAHDTLCLGSFIYPPLIKRYQLLRDSHLQVAACGYQTCRSGSTVKPRSRSLGEEGARHPPGCDDKAKKKLEIFVMKSWVRKFMAFKLVEVFYHGPEGGTGQCDWLTPGLRPELKRVLELGQPRLSPSLSAAPAAPQRAGRQPGHRQRGCASAFWQRIGPYISSLCRCKNNLALTKPE